MLAGGAGVLALLCVLSSVAIAMTACQPSRPSDARDYWAWRLIDGRQCWYQGQPGRSKATLFWPAEQPSSAEPEVEQPEQLAMADEERALRESYPGLSSVMDQKSLKNCRTISRRRPSSCRFGESSALVSIGCSGWTGMSSAADAGS